MKEDTFLIRGRDDFAEVFKELRKSRGLTLKQVVDQTEDMFADPSHLFRLEGDEYKFNNIDKLADYLSFYGYEIRVVKKQLSGKTG